MLRELTAADAESFWALRLRGFLESPESFGSSYDEAVSRPLSDVARELDQEGVDDFVLGAWVKASLVGIMGLRRERRRKRSHRAELWGLHVAKEQRTSGIGRSLLDGIIGRALAIGGLEQLLLTVMAQNTAAVRLYERAGFVRYGYAPAAMKLGDRSFDELLMRFELEGLRKSNDSGPTPSSTRG